MERNKIKIMLGFGVFSVFFISAVLLIITNFVSRMSIMLTMSNINFITDIPVIVEPILVVFSVICLIISLVGLAISILFVKKC